MSSPSTATTSDYRELFWGTPRDQRRHWRVFVGGYVVVMLALFALLYLFEGILEPVVGDELGRLVYRALFPVVLFYAVPLVSTVSAYRRGGLLVSAALGVAPALTFGAVVSLDVALRFVGTGEYVTRGDTPLWGMVLMFGLVGLILSLVGFVAGKIASVTVDKLRSR